MSSYQVPGGMAGEIFCRVLFSKFFIFTFGKGSVLTIACLAVERWFVLIKPWNYQATFSQRKLCKYIGFIWFICLGMQSYKLFYVRYFQHSCYFISLPLEKGVRKIIDKHMGPFEGNWQPDVTPKEQLVLEQRGLVPPSQSNLKDMIRKQVEKEVEWHMYK